MDENSIFTVHTVLSLFIRMHYIWLIYCMIRNISTQSIRTYVKIHVIIFALIFDYIFHHESSSPRPHSVISISYENSLRYSHRMSKIHDQNMTTVLTYLHIKWIYSVKNQSISENCHKVSPQNIEKPSARTFLSFTTVVIGTAVAHIECRISCKGLGKIKKPQVKNLVKLSLQKFWDAIYSRLLPV